MSRWTRLRAGLSLVLLVASVFPTNAHAQSTTPAAVLVDGNNAFSAFANASIPISGQGTVASPYIVGPAEITPNQAHGVVLRNTTKYVILKDLTVQGGGKSKPFDGIRLEGVAHVTLEHVDVEFTAACVSILNWTPSGRSAGPIQSSDIAVRNSTLKACAQGAAVTSVNRFRMENTRASVNGEDVRLTNSPNASFYNNNFSIDSDGVGFSFQDETSMYTTINESNVVNFAKMQWYSNLRPGTPEWTNATRIPDISVAGTQLSIADKEVHVKGTTNIGQIVCYGCSNVTFERPRAASGIAVGVLFVNSANVSVNGAIAEGNAGPGVELRRVTDGSIRDAAASANGDGAQLNSTVRSTIAGGTFVGNAGAGISVSASANATISTVAVRNNRDGILAERSNLTRLSNVIADNNSNDGVKATAIRPSPTSQTTCQGRFPGACIKIENSQFSGNGANGVELVGITGANLTGNLARSNGRAGVFATSTAGANQPTTASSRIFVNTIYANKEAGVWLSGAGAGVRVESNDISDQPAAIRLTNSVNNLFDQNNITLGPGNTGFVFDDEASYENNLCSPALAHSEFADSDCFEGPTPLGPNLVNGTAVQWFVTLPGSSTNRVRISDIVVGQQNLTNIAQFMVYKSSYVDITNVRASNGTRGILLLNSASINLTESEASDSDTGVELRGSQTISVYAIHAQRDNVGVRVFNTINATIRDVVANGSIAGISLEDMTSKGAVVERINATGVEVSSVHDVSFKPGPPPRSNHRIVDAGLDQLMGRGQNVTFDDAIATARFGSEKILSQSWAFGDGNTTDSVEDTILRPTHVYLSVGNYTATYTVETAAGKLSDDVLIRVVGPPQAPRNLAALIKARSAVLNWTEPVSDLPIQGYKVYRGKDPEHLTLFKNLTGSLTSFTDSKALADAWYAISGVTAAGEGPQGAPTHVVLPPSAETNATTTTPEATKGAPLPAWVPAGALVVAALLARVAGRRRERAP